MRRTWGVVALLLVLTGVGCSDKPKRNLRPPEAQYYDLPPAAPQWSNPPVYPEDKTAPVDPNKKFANPNVGGLSGPGGAGGMGGAPMR